MARKISTLREKPGRDQMFVKRNKGVDIGSAIAGMKPGESREGFLGDGNLSRTPDYVPPREMLDDDLKQRKVAIRELLIKIIQPNSLSSKSTIEVDRRSLAGKLNKATLKELERYLPENITAWSTDEMNQKVVSESDKAIIQENYMKISP